MVTTLRIRLFLFTYRTRDIARPSSTHRIRYIHPSSIRQFLENILGKVTGLTILPYMVIIK